MSPQPGSSQHQQYAYPYGAYPYQPTATPFYPAQQPVMVNTQTPQAPPPKQIMVQHRNVSPLAYKLSQQLPTPPFSRLEPSEESLRQQPTKRMKRKSKFTKEQDDLIIELKKAGKSWVEIAEQANTGTYLAARNRYQVLIGQQGGGSSDCGPEDVMELRHVADQGEMEKIRYLVREFEKNTGKAVDQKQIREFLRYLFWKDPTFFDVDETYLAELLQIQASR
ncbi:hypothetical protein OGAPHI_002966 [Ogataea philodendri]|uniref:HTH myb-type domain-containing protein n=1 Tax=Ogataea philodendri TaxID=1378263 RepID=A0A9P8P9L6_9ASCO|nr:uncharacterized protein OGAPHI_002966 [Ogataea philodendri]KAH3667317.1 hypothetical protein OGAPHI_002966 [Ogataea philodendri]